ncbi:MAG: hypothetical protein RR508_08595, partial [Oscillospiraceae bacterium]
MQSTYYIPVRLERKTMISQFSLRDIIVLSFMCMFLIPLSFSTSVLLLTPILVYGTLAFNIDSRTIGSKMYHSLIYIFNEKQYTLKEVFENENN